MGKIEIFSTEKGKPLLVYDSYVYNLERKTKLKSIFRCQNRDCKGRIHTNLSMDSISSGPTAHSHSANLDKMSVIKLQKDIKSRAAISEEPTSNILHSALRTFPLHSAGSLPKNDSLIRSIRRQRQVEPLDKDGRLPSNLRKTDRGEDFVSNENKQLIVFTTKSNLLVLKNCKHWFADGTLKVCSDDFYQLFTLHGLFMSSVIPLVYGVLIGKSFNDYNEFFELILKQNNYAPESILTDFEAAKIKSVHKLFPNILHKGDNMILFECKSSMLILLSGCLFHFGQCVWRKFQSCGLTKKYHDDQHFHINVKKLIALAFVPVVDVVKAFELLESEFDDNADELISYFEKTWIGERKRRGNIINQMLLLITKFFSVNGRKIPQFTHELWNVYDRVVADLPRSNNAIEGCHNAFANRVLTAHPTIPKLTDKIRREQSKFEIDIEQSRQGHEPKPKKASYRKLDERIKRLVQAYNNNDLVQYLSSVAANVNL
ncbi:unnamed protein product [Rotaria socialis]|uniref:FLYWCH-type domain-containing protein n=1 Tax=Rotaria socialis TaxID=392032 RepID=A0A817VJN8_9BILA|nr:unnamed protein product [Rotaria socialis]